MIELAISSELHQTFCSQMKAWRQTKGLTQATLAKRMGVAQPWIAQLESGRREPTLSTVEQVAKGLRMSVENLLFLEPAEVTA